jgi:hypothetical protein
MPTLPNITSFNKNNNQIITDPSNTINQDNIIFNGDIGYIDGYGKYTTKSAAYKLDGTQNVTTITQGPEHVKTPHISKMLDNHIDIFRKIYGYNNKKSKNQSDYKEDPIFIIYDVKLITNDSPLFNNVEDFLTEYSQYDDEIKRIFTKDSTINRNYYDEFISKLYMLFPTDKPNESTGIKRHYIESISGLDVLHKKIIDYPKDEITFTLSEDITLFTEYLTELYNNMVFSYDTQRYLIPENLLRFKIQMTVRDIRNIKNTKIGVGIDESVIESNNSQMIYIFHDCQFNFFNTKSFGSEIVLGGWGANVSKTPAKTAFTMNFKSFSKIMVPLLIDDSLLIDFRENSVNEKDYYVNNIQENYKSQTDYVAAIKINSDNNIATRTGNISTKNKKPGFSISSVVSDFKKDITSEIKEVRQTIIHKILDEVEILKTEAQKELNKKVGFTIGKVNVYYDSLTEKVTRFSFMFSDFLDKETTKLNVTITGKKEFKPNIIKGNIYSNDLNIIDANRNANMKAFQNQGESQFVYNPEDKDKIDNALIKKLLTFQKEDNNAYNGNNILKNPTYNQKNPNIDIPNGTIYDSIEKNNTDNIMNTNRINFQKEDQNVYDKKGVPKNPTYNQKLPFGIREDSGKYHDKQPKGTVEPISTYHDKIPSGTVEPDGQYNIKFPSGSVESIGTYHDKQPKGNIN